MSKSCTVCGKRAYSDFCVSHKPRKSIKTTPKHAVKRRVKPSVARKAKVGTTNRPKRKTRSQLVKELDKVFSEYIRRRDDGKPCVTCDVRKPWREMQACHYISRGKYGTRWDETNVHAGCYRCNVLLKGNYTEYALFMVQTYGAEHLSYLKDKSLNAPKITTPEIEEKIADYKERLAKLNTIC